MSIAEQITALSNDRDAIRQAILTKGGTCPSSNGFDDFATDIATIPSGGQTFAMVLVNYPQNSTLTATNVDGFKDIFPSSSANPQRLYYVSQPSGETQTCVFSITDGTQTKSETVSGITVGTARTITLSYWDGHILIGDETYASITGGYSAVNCNEYTLTTNGIYFKSNSSGGCVLTVNAIDLTEFSTIKFVCKGSNPTTSAHSVGYFSSRSYSGQVAGTTYGSSTGYVERTVDISGVSGSYYIGGRNNVGNQSWINEIQLL